MPDRIWKIWVSEIQSVKGTLTFDEKIVEKLKKARRPITKKDLRSFVSLCGFYQKFIKNFNTKAAPLTDLTKKGEPEKMVWTAEYEWAYSTLKGKLTERPLLRLPDMSKEFILCTDASSIGLGVTLHQRDDTDPPLLFPVAYANRN